MGVGRQVYRDAASDLATTVAAQVTIERSGRLLKCAKLLLTHAMPTIDLTDDEHAAVTSAIRRAIEQDRPAPRASTPCAQPWRTRSDSGGGATKAADSLGVPSGQ